MRSRQSYLLIVGLLGGALSPAGAAFKSTDLRTLSASATVGGSNIIIHAATLPSQALFGTNLVVPVTLESTSGPINPNNLQVDIVYQLLDSSGTSALTTPTIVHIPFIAGPANGSTLKGTAIIPRAELAAIQQGGRVTYVFQAQQTGTGAGTMLNNSGAPASPIANITALARLPSPFVTSIRDPWCEAVSPEGSVVSASNLANSAGQTAVSLPRGAVSSPGTLCIHVENPDALASGPGGSKAAAVYTITLQNTSLAAPAQLVLSYPADLNGRVLDLGSDPGTLGIYWLDESNVNGQWRALSRATLDSTLHTLTGTTGHFSTFGLFPAGDNGSAGLRPAERIITPNNDGHNDYAHFSGVDDVKIFDIRGRRIRDISTPLPACNNTICWDGRDDSGQVVESGVYIYQFTSNGERVSGVIGVAK